MELSEALKIIDATAWLFHSLLDISLENDIAELIDDNGGIGITGANLYTVIGRDQCPVLRYKYKYRSGKEFEGIVPPIISVCDLLINIWPSTDAKRIRNRLQEMEVLTLGLKLLGFDERAIPVVKYNEQLGIDKYDELQEGHQNPPILHFELLRIIKKLSYAFNMTEKFDDEERPSFLVNVGKSDEEAKAIDKELRDLARFPSIPVICSKLREMAKANKILLPEAEKAYNEMVRLGMATTGRGFAKKTFQNNYEKIKI